MNERREFIQKLGAGIITPAWLGGLIPKGVVSGGLDQSLAESDFWQQVRDRFPLTRDRVYLNNGTFGPAPYPVLEALQASQLAIYTSGEYGHTQDEREKLAAFVGAKSSEISLTHNTTEGINIMAWGLNLKSGDEVILTTHEHVGNGLPWLNRAKLHGIVIKTFAPADNQQENLNQIQKLVGPKTKVIAIPQVTCTTGLVFPIREICSWARSKSIYTAIDGAHGPGMLDLNLHDLGCDFYASCYHKWMLGPVGTGFLYVREGLLDELQAIQVGGYSDSGWDITVSPPVLEGYVPTAHRYDYGTQSRPLYVGAAAAADFHMQIGKIKVEERIRQLNEYLYAGLRELDSRLELLSPEEPESRAGMVSFRPKRMDYQELGRALGKNGFRIRQVPESGVNAIRVSTHIYTSLEEIDQLIHTIEAQLS